MANHVRNLIKFDCPKEKLEEIYHSIYADEGNGNGVDFAKIVPLPDDVSWVPFDRDTHRAIELYMTSVNPEVTYYGNEKKMSYDMFDRLWESVDNGPVPNTYNGALTLEEIAEFILSHGEQEMLKLGERAVKNLENYGAMTLYEWAIKYWGTKRNSYCNAFDGETIAFCTAWTAPHPILAQLSLMYPNIVIEHKWADEDIGYNCGRAVYLAGHIRVMNIPASDEEGECLAREVWDAIPIEDWNS